MVAIVGRKHSGKTTLVVKLCAELHRRGYRVMTIKHGSHTFNIDPSTTDTYRHYHEGQAERVAMVAPDKFALVERRSAEMSAEEVAEKYLGDADVIVCEGFKKSPMPKIEVFRKEAQESPLWTEAEAKAVNRVAIVSDVEISGEGKVFVMRGEWIAGVTDFVEQLLGLTRN